jgi:hypothetical protein
MLSELVIIELISRTIGDLDKFLKYKALIRVRKSLFSPAL